MTEFGFQMERLVVAFFVLVTDHLVGARHDAACTTRAETRVDDLFVEFFPLVGPAFGRCWSSFDGRHVNDSTPPAESAKSLDDRGNLLVVKLAPVAVGDLELVAHRRCVRGNAREVNRDIELRQRCGDVAQEAMAVGS